MLVFSWLRNNRDPKVSKSPRRSRRAPNSARPSPRWWCLRLEQLEDRTLLSVVTPVMETFQQTGATQLTGDQSLKDYFLGGSFNKSSSFGSITHIPVLGDYGAEASISLSGMAGLDFDFTGTGGTVNSTYNATLNQSFTDPTAFGQMVTFSPANTSVTVNSGSFSTTSPSFGYGARVDMGLSGSIGGEFAVGSTYGGSVSFSGPNLAFPLMSVNEDNDGIVELMGIPFVGASPGLGLNATLQALVGGIENYLLGAYFGLTDAPPPPARLKLNLNTQPGLQLSQDLQFQVGFGPQKLGPYTLPKAANFIPNVGLDLASMTEEDPTVAPSSSTLQAGGLLSATDKGTVAQLSIQMGPLASLILGQPQLAVLSSADSLNIGPLAVSFTPLSFQLQPTLYAVQTASIQPVSQLTYNLSVPSGDALPVVTLDGKQLNNGKGVSSVTFTPGKDTVGIAFEGYPITVTPSWDFQEMYNDQVTLNADLNAMLTIGELSVSVPGLGSYTFGPLYQQPFNFADTQLETLVSKSTPIYNQPFALPSFTIGSGFQLSTAVTTMSDSDTSGSLRFAVDSANAEPLMSTIIQLPAGVYQLSMPPMGTDGSTGNLVVTSHNLIIMGNGSTIDASGLGDRVLHVENGANVQLVDLTIEDGDAESASDSSAGFGGGVLQDSGSTLTLDNCLVTMNTAPGNGGGGGISSQGNLSIINSTISKNNTGGSGGNGSGGGIEIQNGSLVIQDSTISGDSVSNITDAYGGGIAATNSSVTIESSSVSNNTADGEFYDANGRLQATGQAHGGGLYDTSPSGNLLIVNSTFVENQAISGAEESSGGGMLISMSGSQYAYLVNDTVVNNSATDVDGGIDESPFIVMKNTIVASNMDTRFSVPDDLDYDETVYSAGNNLFGTRGSGLVQISAHHDVTFSSTGVPTASASGFDPTDIVPAGLNGFSPSIDPQLGSLGNNGGPTQTLLPQPGSPVIGAGGNTFSVPSVLAQLPMTDQRGLARSVNGSTDIGAVEYQYDLAVTGSQSLANSTLTYALQVANNGPDPASNVTLADVLPSGLTFVSAAGPASGWTVSNPAVGSSGTVTFTLNSGSLLSSGQSASFTLLAKLTALQPVNNSITLIPTPPSTYLSDTNQGNNQLTLSVYGEGQSFTNAVLFSFASPNPDYTAADFTATVNWGDSTSNTSSDGTGNVAVVAAPLGGFEVIGSHNYSEAENYSLSISVASADGLFSTQAMPELPIVDQPLTAGALTVPTVFYDPTNPNNTVLYAFRDANSGLTASSFTASVHWGDGTSNTSSDGSGKVSVVADPNTPDGWEVLGTHTYASGTEGAIPQVQVTDSDGLQFAKPVLFHFIDGNPLASAADFTATVNWGDGNSSSSATSSAVSVVADSSGGFDVIGNYTYAASTGVIRNGTFSVQVQDKGGASTSASGTLRMAFTLTAGSLTIPSVTTEGQSIKSTLLFHFTDNDPMASASEFTATVAWGDGASNNSGDGTSTVTVVADNGGFDVDGSHTFGEVPSGATFAVIIQDVTGAVTGASTTTFTVTDPPVVATGGQTIKATDGIGTSSVLLATFTDPGGAETISNYSADINWGDGTGTQLGAGTIVANANGSFSVYGSHFYTETSGPQQSSYTITVTLHHEATPPQIATSTADVANPAVLGVGNVQLTAMVGQDTGTQTLATFTDPGGIEGTSAYQATINWGDGTTSTGTISFAANSAFSFASLLPTGQGPVDVVAADLLGNGHVDLVVANSVDGTVEVFLGNGDGTFQSPEIYTLGATPASVAVASLRGNGKLDIVTANPTNNTVSILLNNGDGTFTLQPALSTGSTDLGPTAVILADVNGDGKPDLITANISSGTVSVFLGNGNGTFGSPQSFSTGGSGPISVAAGDVNGDGKADLVVANENSNTVSVLLGNGDGTFQTPQASQILPVGSLPVSVALANLGNGHLDIITANSGSNNVSVLLGNGKGMFQSAVNYATGTVPVAVLVADVNGDGKPDLITANNGSNNISVLLGNGDGTFQAATNYAVGTAPNSVAVGNLNGGGIPEIVAANTLDNDLTVLAPSFAVQGHHAYTKASGSTPLPITITISYESAPTTTISTDSATVAKGTPTVSVSDLSGTYNALPVTLTVTVAASSANGSTPTGTVDFFDTSTGVDLTIPPLTLTNGTATLTSANLPAGTNTITLTYSGDSNFAKTSTTATIVVIPSILVLDPSTSGALSLSGNANISVPGSVVVDSKSSTALMASGNAVLKAGSIQVVGNYQKAGNATLSPTPKTSITALQDPLMGLAAPSLSGQATAVTISGNASQTLQPGIYSQITISGNASVTFSKGIYIIEGGLTVSGTANVTGSGILIYNTGSKYPNAGGTYGAINLSTSGTVKLNAATTGSYAGILIYQDPNNTQVLTISANASGSNGLIYAPKAQLVLTGNAQLNAALDVDDLTVNGNAVDNGTSPPGGGAAANPARTPTATGLNRLSAGGTVSTGLPTLLAGTDNESDRVPTAGEKETVLLEPAAQFLARFTAEDSVDAGWLFALSKEQTAATDALFSADSQISCG
jgi:uncharacterized repeat protein (TIGR01451 family)